MAKQIVKRNLKKIILGMNNAKILTPHTTPKTQGANGAEKVETMIKKREMDKGKL